MIVWRADRFGLAQLHQLSGRVGRGGRRGQVMLLTDPQVQIADTTLKRLRELQTFDRLGAGFAISARDLDLRGAGDLLGETQTGHIKLIGVDLYQEMLQRSLRSPAGKPAEVFSTELNVGPSGRFPDDWIPEPDLRIGLYCWLSRLTDSHELDQFVDELEDRFGEIPSEAQTLMDATRVKILAAAVQIMRIDVGPSAIAFTPRKSTEFDGARVGLRRSGERALYATKSQCRSCTARR
jgi:transcription-repair coupling factor (superfamily II helicase)